MNKELIKIALDDRQWLYDPTKQLGSSGGFGKVFEGYSAEGDVVAVKKLHIDAKFAAYREARIANELKGNSYQNVLNAMDSGLDQETEHYFIIMPKAEFSLADHIFKNKIEQKEAFNILIAICNGLQEVANISHRDLKPENILFHDHTWKISDFGIAKFVEEATSKKTLRDALTPPYASPEQWNFEHPTQKTDIYAIGCIAFTLLTGSPPFSGPSTEDYYQQHINTVPPDIIQCHPRAKSVIYSCLRKAPEVRPSIKICINAFKSATLGDTEHTHFNALSQVSAQIASIEAQKEAQRQEEQRRISHINNLHIESRQIITEIIAQLFSTIQEHAPNSTHNIHAHELYLGQAKIQFEIARTALPQPIPSHSEYKIINVSKLYIHQGMSKYQFGSNIIYASAHNDEYRAHEINFFSFMQRKTSYEPFPLDEHQINDIHLALSKTTTHIYSPAFGPTPIDFDHTDDFIERWIYLLTKAANGTLSAPTQLPIATNFYK
ncbi:serine/threonine protein kinase [Nitratidesulfovibrio sp. HK-II]|uniref:serine/threonine-protein kinase n=1 Tax=Nitratidesulfovibrio sp. HK-II TaxID=2009266 RepID=UPI000E2E5C31|nr:serine/threonine-protein kinase [Nitratidesulfovibrio sp. HK-II]GBO96542.1 serine/threonine-protein kinase PknA [Nitratidesulfovibrio sp. HK-II]